MKKQNINNLKLGLFVSAGLILFVVGIYYLGKMQNLFQSNLIIYSEFQDVKGLQTGNNVRYMGINIGTVMGISILNDSTVLVEIGIDEEVGQFIRKNAQIEINSDGVMGSKILTIHSGNPEAGYIDNNDKIKSFNSVNAEEILNELQYTANLTRNAAKNLLEITDKMNTGTGDFAKLINDDPLIQNIDKLSADFGQLTLQAESILKKVNEGDNDFATLLNHNNLTNKLNGTLSNTDTASVFLKAASKEFLLTAKSLNQGKGIIPKLLHDSIFSSEVDTTLYKANQAINKMEETAESIENSWIVNLFSGKKKQN